jgi:hypothetical protein
MRSRPGFDIRRLECRRPEQKTLQNPIGGMN